MPDESIGIFIATSFPGMIGISEIEFHVASLFDRGILMKFGAVIRCDGFEEWRMPPDKLDHFFVERLSGFISKFANELKACFPFKQCDNTGVTTFAEHGVDFPMPSVASGFNGIRALRNMTLVG